MVHVIESPTVRCKLTPKISEFHKSNSNYKSIVSHEQKSSYHYLICHIYSHDIALATGCLLSINRLRKLLKIFETASPGQQMSPNLVNQKRTCNLLCSGVGIVIFNILDDPCYWVVLKTTFDSLIK